MIGASETGGQGDVAPAQGLPGAARASESPPQPSPYAEPGDLPVKAPTAEAALPNSGEVPPLEAGDAAAAMETQFFAAADLLPLPGNFIAVNPPASVAGRSYYVDATAGSDANDGLSPGAPFQSFAKVMSLLADGDTVNLKRGEVWHDQLRFSASDVTVQGYGAGANPLIDGDDGSRHGIVIQGRDAHVEDIDVTAAHNGLYIAGVGSSATVIGGNFTANGTGIAAGEGGHLVLADGVRCTGSLLSRGAGDGIQIVEDAAVATHVIRNAVCDGNDISGVNAKIGIVTVADSSLSFNGEPGWIAQNNLSVFHISGSRIEGNNRHDSGTGQASIEDSATVYSIGNFYVDPKNGTLGTVQINMISTNGALYSVRDHFVNQSGQYNTLGSIRVHTDGNPATVSISESVFDHASGSGAGINAYGATALTLTLESNVFNMVDGAAVRVNPAASFGAQLATNDLFRSDGGRLFQIEDTGYYTPATLAQLFADHAVAGQAPTGISLSSTAVSEIPGAVVGALEVSDPDNDASFSFVVSNELFEVVGSPGDYRLKLVAGSSLDYGTEPSIPVTVTATDHGGHSISQSFTLDVIQPPAALPGLNAGDFLLL